MAPKLRIDVRRREVFVSKREVSLTPKEFDILVAIVGNPHISSREFLLMRVYGHEKESTIETRTIDVHVSRIRRKLKIPIFKTVALHGYKYIGC